MLFGLFYLVKVCLYDFVMMFMGEIWKRKLRIYVFLSIIVDIFVKIIIFRDNVDVVENEFFIWWKLLKFLNDVECEVLFIERVNIIKKLIEFFFEDVNFYVYLGRIILICCLEEEENVENCFEIVVNFCKSWIKGKVGLEFDEGIKNILKYVYYMYGMFYL